MPFLISIGNILIVVGVVALLFSPLYIFIWLDGRRKQREAELQRKLFLDALLRSVVELPALAKGVYDNKEITPVLLNPWHLRR